MENQKHRIRFIQHTIAALLMLIVMPFLIILDLLIEIYHRIGFPLCRMKLVKRKNYVIIDRHRLKYLNPLEKFGCVYCGYANGLFAYFLEIANRTEEYWCAIKHKKYRHVIKQAHQKKFLKYGDEKSFKKKYKN